MSQPTHIEAFVHAYQTHEVGKYSFTVWSSDMSSCGYIPIAKIEVPVPTITEDSIRARHIVLLRLKRDEVYAEARARAGELEEQIARIECLTYTPSTSTHEPEIPL